MFVLQLCRLITLLLVVKSTAWCEYGWPDLKLVIEPASVVGPSVTEVRAALNANVSYTAAALTTDWGDGTQVDASDRLT